MRWPPNQAWTSSTARNGFRHFELLSFGGKGDERWVELVAVMDKDVRIKVSWNEMKIFSKWTSGWLQLPKEEN
tara:strand:- start:794 stop:1012 length:219 start_codon:yes stop_codon:yes gene_type:complete